MLVTLDTCDGYDWHDGLPISQTGEMNDTFCQALFSEVNSGTLRFAKTVVLNNNRAMVEDKTADIFGDRLGKFKPMDAGGKVEGKIDIHFGGEQATITVGISAEAHDNDGNHGGVSVKVNDDKTVDVSFSGGRDVGDQGEK